MTHTLPNTPLPAGAVEVFGWRISVLSLTMRSAPVGSSSGKNAAIAIATAPTIISPNPRGFSDVALFTATHAIGDRSFSRGVRL